VEKLVTISVVDMSGR